VTFLFLVVKVTILILKFNFLPPPLLFLDNIPNFAFFEGFPFILFSLIQKTSKAFAGLGKIYIFMKEIF